MTDVYEHVVVVHGRPFDYPVPSGYHKELVRTEYCGAVKVDVYVVLRNNERRSHAREYVHRHR